MTSLKREQIEAAQEFTNTAIAALNTERGVHAETAVAGVARMAGTFLFRSFGFTINNIQPGQVVLSDQANEKGPGLIQILAGVLSHLGVGLDEKPGDASGPEHQPNQSFLDTQRRLEPAFTEIMARHGLSSQEAAEAAAVATAFLIHECKQVLDPNVAFNVAVYGFIEGSKTAPDPVAL